MRPAALVPLLALLALVATGVPARAVGVPTNFVVENAIPGAAFDTPVQVTFLPDGRWLVVEKRGTVWVVQNGVKLATPFFTRENEILNNGDRGLLSVAVDPNYNTNRYVYFLYTVDPDSNGVDDNDDAFGRLTRYQTSTPSANVVDYTTRTILMGASWTSGSTSLSASHTIGTLRFGTDGTLLVGCGDGAQFNALDKGGQDGNGFGAGKTDPAEDIGAFRAQYLDCLPGKILRIDPLTGLGLPSNPFYQAASPGSPRSRIWCFGMRNPFRFNLRPGTGSTDRTAANPGTLYIGDVGLSTWEEQNVAALGGRNFGWPCYEGFGGNSTYMNASPSHDGCNTLSSKPGVLTPPVVAYPHSSSQGTSTPPGMIGNTAIGGAFYTAATYPIGYQGGYFYGDYGQNYILFSTPDPNNGISTVTKFGTAAEGPVDFENDPANGDILYVSISSNQVRRIRWTGVVGNDHQPVAVASATTPTVGNAPLTVGFTSAGTTDSDGDPLTFSWNFGDGSLGTGATTSHTFTSSGNFSVILTADDGRGGIGKATVQVTVGNPAGGFPSSPIRDTFDRPNAALGSPWVDPIYGLAGLNITGNSLTQACCSYAAPVWSGASFGPDQEAYVRLTQLTAGSPEHDLMLKLQSPTYSAAHIEVRYDDARGGVYVATYDGSAGWVDRGTPIAVRFTAGQQLGARAFGNGTVEVYQNGTLIGSRSLAGWSFAGSGGYIGLTLDRDYTSALDDFGGGNVVAGNTKPTATILSPPDKLFYISGQVISLSGNASDAQDPSSALTTKWVVDLYHNTHIHPGWFVATGNTATMIGENHDDGTGTFEQVNFIATDTGGLTDTAKVRIYPEVDVSPAGLSVTPASPTVTDSLLLQFRIRDLGRMPAPYSHWLVRAGATKLAEGDTLIGALDSVLIAVKVANTLPAGTYALRATVDTLGKITEPIETNNAQTITVIVASGPNRQPVARAGATPTSGLSPLAVTFNSTGTSDPDGDPLTYAWAFGDGTNGSGPAPAHTYNGAAVYTATLTVTDGRGGSSQATVQITVTGRPAFPSTPVVDNFNRADGPVGPNWVGDVTGFVIAGNQATQNCCYVSTVWNGAVFGADQEAYITIATPYAAAREQDIMLKVQGTSYTTGHIEVRYDPTPGRVQVSSYDAGKWTNRGASITVSFAAGDRFGARALANGDVEVYKNNVLLGTRSVTAWRFYTNGGRIGLTLENNAPTRFDDFGGGTVPGSGAALAQLAPTERAALDAPAIAPILSLSDAYPNPTGSSTSLRLTLPALTSVDFRVHDIQGREVWHETAAYGSGRWTLTWPGRGRNGDRLAAGVYLARVTVGDKVFMRRIALLP